MTDGLKKEMAAVRKVSEGKLRGQRERKEEKIFLTLFFSEFKAVERGRRVLPERMFVPGQDTDISRYTIEAKRNIKNVKEFLAKAQQSEVAIAKSITPQIEKMRESIRQSQRAAAQLADDYDKLFRETSVMREVGELGVMIIIRND
jgi:hypothetical protein